MSCQRYLELISADLDAELSAGEEPALWDHLSHCEECRRWRHDQLEMRSAFQHWPEESLPSMATETTLSLSPVKQPVKQSVYQIPRALAWAAAVVLLIQGLFVTSAMVRTPDTTEPALVLPVEETVETIVLTAKDRVSFSTTDNPLMIGKPITHPDENGG